MESIHWSYYILLVILFIAIYTDSTKQKIYNWLTFPTLLLGFVISFFNKVGIVDSLIGFIFAFMVSLIIYITGGFKGGDVKLISAVGAWLGKSLILPALLYIFISGGILGVLFTIKNGTFMATYNKLKSFFWGFLTPGIKPHLELRESINKKMPYGIAISIGTVLALIYPNLLNSFNK